MPEITMETGATSAGCLAGRCLSMEDVIDVRIYETSPQMQMSHHRRQEFGKNAGGSGQAKGGNLPLINNELPCLVPEGQTKDIASDWAGPAHPNRLH